ncbi:MAG: hypothetical protein FJ104_08240 [Deltaproteobacteria bacterium]|nr:hypothetical protein [Deltaproteobacteria bacterium]
MRDSGRATGPRRRRGSVIFLLLLSACSDPTRERERDALGPEPPGPGPGPFHRPGQPCLVCHDEFVVAGTIFEDRAGARAASGAVVRLVDFTGAQARAVTNDAGNFFFTRGELDPSWPLWVKVERGDLAVEMTSAVHREGSCAGCHTREPGPLSPGPVHLEEP